MLCKVSHVNVTQGQQNVLYFFFIGNVQILNLYIKDEITKLDVSSFIGGERVRQEDGAATNRRAPPPLMSSC